MKGMSVIVLLVLLSVVGVLTISCGTGSDSSEPIVWVWYPNESTPERAAARQALGELVYEATGRKVEHQLTTDYSIAIEAIVNGNAGMSWLGGQGFVRAHHDQPAVEPLVVHTDGSGDLDLAKYYSMLGVRRENASEYKRGGAFDLDALRQKKFSFVSNSSTSGFVVPSSILSDHFDVDSEELLEGGSGKVFSDVLFGGSHQGSFLNIIEGRADVGAFCNTCVAQYIEFVSGDFIDPKAGDVIRITDDAVAPFDKFSGEESTIIATVPVLNECVVVNSNVLSREEITAIEEAFVSDAATNNPRIFGDRKDAQNPSFFEDGQRFVAVDGAWYNPIREMSGLPLQ
ncbi:MAG: PhnD/SsuA/transferrin family substrate-binding protein [Fibrobacterota bacterium]